LPGPPRRTARSPGRPVPAPRPQPFRTRRLDETTGPDFAQAVGEVRLAVGVLVGVHGIHGELKLQLWTDTPDHLKSIRSVWIGEEQQTRRLTGVRLTPDRALIRIAGVSSPEVARTFVGQTLYIAGTDARPLDEGELFLYQLVGLRVSQEDGTEIGSIADVIETGANDVLVIKPPAGGPDILYPHHREFVVGVDLEAGTMTVRPLDFLN
jgi:16S rRNA processing protein RimM